MILFTLFIDMFVPLGIAHDTGTTGLIISSGVYSLKLLFLAGFMAVVESTRAKVRIFQIPTILGGSFVLAVLSLLTLIMVGK
jgi:formate hydrogenlyase subunit 4